MQRREGRALVAKVGTWVFAVALGLPVTLSPASARASVMVASAAEGALAPLDAAVVVAELPGSFDLPEARLPRAAREDATASNASVASTSLEPERASELARSAIPAPAAPAAAATPRPVPTFPPPEALVLDGTVIASWYGPGFYGNRTACGQTYTPEIMGVAHRTLPCGTRISITSPAGVTIVVPVIDRGPYIAGRSLDLSNATRIALSCSDLCRVRMTVIQ